MRTVSIICPVCRDLVEVVDKALVRHRGGCPMSGMRYVPSPTFKTGAGGPSFEVLGVKTVEPGTCEDCGREHDGATAALVRIRVPDPSAN